MLIAPRRPERFGGSVTIIYVFVVYCCLLQWFYDSYHIIIFVLIILLKGWAVAGRGCDSRGN